MKKRKAEIVTTSRLGKKSEVDEDVYSLALRRMRFAFERFDKIIVLFSGGKDSTAALHVTLTVAEELGRLPVDVVHYDEEAIPPETVEYCERVRRDPRVNFRWLCIPIAHRNACSRLQPIWHPWHPEERHLWVRELPIGAETVVEGFTIGMDTIETTPALYGPAHGTVGVVMGIRCQESLTRYGAVAAKEGFECFISPMGDSKNQSKIYPIYDWAVEDVWVAPAKFGWDYNRAYDKMEAAGLSRTVARCSPPFGEQPIRRLHSYKVCWPHLWSKMTARVHGAATAARYANSSLYGVGVKHDDKPDGITWREYTEQTIAKLDADAAAECVHSINSLIRNHSVYTEAPVPDVDPIASGITWKLLYVIAANGGDKLGRQSQKVNHSAKEWRKKNGLPTMRRSAN